MITRQATGIPASKRALGAQIRLTAAGAVVVLAATAGIAVHQIADNGQRSQRITVATNPVAAAASSRTAPMGGAAEALAERAVITTATLPTSRERASTDTGAADGVITLASLPESARSMGGYADWLSTRTTGSAIGAACGIESHPLSAMRAC